MAALSIKNISEKIIFFLSFCFPFVIFSKSFGGGETKIGLTEILVFLLLLINLCYTLYIGKIKKLVKVDYLLLWCINVAFLSLVTSFLTYGWVNQLSKGIRQLFGIILCIILFTIVRKYSENKKIFIKIVNWLWIGSLLLMTLGIWQWIANNIIHTNILADWSWVDQLFGNSFLLWRPPGQLGPLSRVNAMAGEPAHYCRYLIIGMGLVLFRLNPPTFFRKKFPRPKLPSVTICIIYIIGYCMSLSILGFLGLMIALIFYLVLFNMISIKKILIYSIFGVLILITVAFLTGGKFQSKVATILFINPGQEKENVESAASALTVASHLETSLEGFKRNPLLGWGIGGHPEAFERYAPAWITINPSLIDLHKEDAASLAIRLFSEMGLLGFLVFLYFYYFIVREAWKAIKIGESQELNYDMIPFCTAVLIGTVSLIITALMRSPAYINIYLWFLLALTSVIPKIMLTNNGKNKYSNT